MVLVNKKTNKKINFRKYLLGGSQFTKFPTSSKKKFFIFDFASITKTVRDLYDTYLHPKFEISGLVRP